MKVLFLANYIYDNELKNFRKNKTGYGLMVKDIAISLSNLVDIYLLTNTITKKKYFKGIHIINHQLFDILKAQTFKSMVNSFKSFFSCNETFFMRLRFIYYSLDIYYIKKVIKKFNPDIIHVHGLSFKTKDFIEIANNNNKPYIVTLHALIGLNQCVGAIKTDTNYERVFFQQVKENKAVVTVISSGMKDRILKEFNSEIAEDITVIKNGVDINSTDFNDTRNIKKAYNISENSKIMLCIGSICNRKNQYQIVEAYHLLPQNIKNNLYIFFIGNDTLDGKLKNLITKLGYKKNLILCGFVERSNLNAFFENANYNIVASEDEAFGLSIIEAFNYGIPTVTFSDLDAIPDLYRKDVMVLAYNRGAKSLSDAIKILLNTKWNAEDIKEYSKNFSMETMRLEYLSLYNKVLLKNEMSKRV